MSDEEDYTLFDVEPPSIPQYSDMFAQRAQAFEYLVQTVATLEDTELKDLGVQMLKALLTRVIDPPVRGTALKAVK